MFYLFGLDTDPFSDFNLVFFSLLGDFCQSLLVQPVVLHPQLLVLLDQPCNVVLHALVALPGTLQFE